VNFFSSTSAKFAAGCPPLPSQMKTAVCPLEDLQCHAEAVTEEQSPSCQEDHQGPPEQSWKQPSTDQVQPMDAETGTDAEEDNYSSDDFALMERDGILDLTEPDGSSTSPQCHQGPDSLHGEEHSEHWWKESSSDQVQPVDAQTRTDTEEDNYSSDDCALMERDGILDLTEPDGSSTSPQCHQRPDSLHGEEHSEHWWKESSSDQVQPMDSQAGSAVYNMEEDNYSGDDFALMKRDGILDFTELDGSRTSPQCSLNSDADGDGVVEDELGQVSPVWKVSAGTADSGDGRVVNDVLVQTSVGKAFAGPCGAVVDVELGETSSVWKACAGSDGGIVNNELGQESPNSVLKVGADSDCGVSNDDFGQSSAMLMFDAGSDKGERGVVMVDLVTPTPVGRLRRIAGMGSNCSRIIDLTASPVVIEL
jgi:structure-specific endonuclease subunit SLX1